MILGITPNFQLKQNSYDKRCETPVLKSHNVGLSTDTVSFTSKKVVADEVKYTFENLFENLYDKQRPLNEVLAVRFVDSIKAVAEELKEFGFKLPEAIDDKAVKGKVAYLDKFRRSGSKPMDVVRYTLYNPNPYDLELFFGKFLPAMKARGYDLLVIPDEVVGKKVKSKKFDLDFRLGGLDADVVSKLPPPFQKCIGKPQKSGYEDIQIRFVDTTVSPKKQTPQELLILFGENYSKAKNDEHYYVYEITRDLKDKLMISQIENPSMHSPEKRVQDNIKILRDLLNNTISKPLFINAKSIDFYGEKPTLAVGLSKAQVDTLTGLMEGIRNKISLYYKNAIARLTESNMVDDMESFVSSLSETSGKSDKTVYLSEILESKDKEIETLKLQRAEDLKIVRAAQKRLQETIEKFGEKS